VWKEKIRRNLAWVSAAGLWMIMLATLRFNLPTEEGNFIFGGMLRLDWLYFFLTELFLFGGSLTVLLIHDSDNSGERGEFYLLILTSILGMTLLAGASDLVMLFLALETTSIPLYILAGFLKKDDHSTEAGFKYLLFGAMTSAFLLYGLSLLYGFSGSTSLIANGQAIRPTYMSVVTAVGTLILVFVGIGFKISAFPLHFWAPDVYEGAPSPVAGFLSTASKAAGFAVFLRILVAVFPALTGIYPLMIAIISALTMTIGNLLAMQQKNIKRMLAYSSIAQAGYMLIGVSTADSFGATSVVFYLAIYLLTNMAAFAIVTLIGRQLGSDNITAYAGLSRRSPALALALLIALLSLGGIPPFAGFVGKVFLFLSGVASGKIWLVIVGVVNAIFALYYYLRVLKTAYLDRADGDEVVMNIPLTVGIPVIICVIGVVIIGVLFTPWFEWSRLAGVGLFFMNN
jgi:NADH-quinone oxidoreductase subunit N